MKKPKDEGSSKEEVRGGCCLSRRTFLSTAVPAIGVTAGLWACGGDSSSDGDPSDGGGTDDTDDTDSSTGTGTDTDTATDTGYPDLGSNVYVVRNGDCFQNIDALMVMLGGMARFVGPTDHVVIKGNAQWPNRGYTHTGCIKAVVDHILAIPGFAGEVYICDNVQDYGGPAGFTASPSERQDNWPDHNWNSLAAEYQAAGQPVAAKQWMNGGSDLTSPSEGEGWVRDYFQFQGMDVCLSYPIFESPLTPGKMIDMKNGVWQDGSFTGGHVKSIFMPTLNNHGSGGDDYAGITSAIKSFFGTTEIPNQATGTINGHRHIHNASFVGGSTYYSGELVGRYIQTMYSPDLYITAAMFTGHDSRFTPGTETRTVLACKNPVTLDYVSARDVIGPLNSALLPDENNSTNRQIQGCLSTGIGTIDPTEFEVIEEDLSA